MKKANHPTTKNFWTELNQPFFTLAPMEDVTDTVFREIIVSVSEPQILRVVFTEFTSTDGLMNERGFERVSERLLLNNSEKELLKASNTKLVAQIWGNNPEMFFKTAKFLDEIKLFDGIDINMGCPVKKVVKKNTCSALIKHPTLAAEIIQATKDGTDLPVSVKTRIGFNTVITDQWISHLLKTNIAALTIHGRTQKMQSDGLADWNEIAKSVKIRDELELTTKIIGNGDVISYVDGINKINTTGVEGVMIGRGVFKNPWVFSKNGLPIDIEERIELLKRHIQLFEKTWSTKKNYNVLKRFFKIYANNFRGASNLRTNLMLASSYKEAMEVISKFIIDDKSINM